VLVGAQAERLAVERSRAVGVLGWDADEVQFGDGGHGEVLSMGIDVRAMVTPIAVSS
jgi:hypothetical protein